MQCATGGKTSRPQEWRVQHPPDDSKEPEPTSACLHHRRGCPRTGDAFHALEVFALRVNGNNRVGIWYRFLVIVANMLFGFQDCSYSCQQHRLGQSAGCVGLLPSSRWYICCVPARCRSHHHVCRNAIFLRGYRRYAAYGQRTPTVSRRVLRRRYALNVPLATELRGCHSTHPCFRWRSDGSLSTRTHLGTTRPGKGGSLHPRS